jgi:hypothetical protein
MPNNRENTETRNYSSDVPRGADSGGTGYRTDDRDSTTRTIIWVAVAIVAALLLWWVYEAMTNNNGSIPGVPNTGSTGAGTTNTNSSGTGSSGSGSSQTSQ